MRLFIYYRTTVPHDPISRSTRGAPVVQRYNQAMHRGTEYESLQYPAAFSNT